MSKISRTANGRVASKLRDVADLLALYGIADWPARVEMHPQAERANAPAWWAPHSDLIPAWLEPCLGMEAAASVALTPAATIRFLRQILKET